ncbi:hypothetical protein OQJ13_10200 [Legionella sp. PATHC035]|uniref:hypothetical protein n=1 Tax=Legionella sp. PATHC035 TaxID=2992040 RepID=UPI002242E964|nr:hypothetical protein [Legionella sp. PATHC035]MCW8409344.1 hypothetical protein [Legionella sp. PATHC035]
MKLIKTSRIYTETELLGLFETIYRDALLKDSVDFIKKYDSFEIPEQLIHFKFSPKGETILHLIMDKIVNLFEQAQNPNQMFDCFLYFFEFLMKHGADINSGLGIDKSSNPITPLSYLLKSQILDEINMYQILATFSQAKFAINNKTYAVLVENLLLNRHFTDEDKKRNLIDSLISFGAEITLGHEAIFVSDQFFKQNKDRWKHDVLVRKQEKTYEKVEKHELAIRRLEQQNNLITEQLAQLTQKMDSLIKSSEQVKTNPEPTWYSFFGL